MCINCRGRHRTLAAVCKVRRELIKDKGKEIRLRSRSRSANRQRFAEATSRPTKNTQIETQVTQMSREQTKTIITKIMASIAYAHYIGKIRTGTFQKTIDEMFDLNNLPRVKFLIKIITEGIRDLFNNITQETQTTENQQANQGQEHTHTEQEAQLAEEVMETDNNKRQRESSQFSPMESVKKKKKETEQTEEIETPTEIRTETTPNLNLSLPPSLQPRPAPSEPGPSRPTASENIEQKKAPQNKPKLSVKDIGIMIYFKKSSRYVIDT